MKNEKEYFNSLPEKSRDCIIKKSFLQTTKETKRVALIILINAYDEISSSIGKYNDEVRDALKNLVEQDIITISKSGRKIIYSV